VKESYFWQTVKAHIPEVHWSRIENVAGSGIPDLNGCLNGKEVWIELKMFRGNRITLRSSQLVWMTKRLRVLGDVVVMARKDDEIWLINGRQVVEMTSDPVISKSTDDKSVSMAPPVESALKVFHKPLDWEDIRRLLFGA